LLFPICAYPRKSAAKDFVSSPRLRGAMFCLHPPHVNLLCSLESSRRGH
jgi:hypothetical protein